VGCGAASADQAAAFFDDSAVREIRIDFPDSNWYNTLFQSHARDPEDPYFPARFRSGDIDLGTIGVRFKGNSSFQRNGIKKPFKLDFNRYDENATFLGLKKLNLNNGDLQPDFLREKLLHDFAGKRSAALRSVFVRLYVNDSFYGLYLAVEQPDKTMMQSRYGEGEDGNLYEAEERMGGAGAGRPNLSWLGTSQSAYENVYLLKTNEEANDFSGLIRFLDILNNTPTAELPERIEATCDVENWLHGMAINNLFVNLDSYLGVGAEYYLYQRSGDGRFVHIQWDHNESFGTTGDGTTRLANPFVLDPFYLPSANAGGGPGGGGAQNNARPLLSKLWAVDVYKRLYLRIMARFLREGFDSESMEKRTRQLADLIRPHVQADPNKPYTMAQFETALNTQVTGGGGTPIYGLAQFVRERYNYLRPLLNSYAEVSDVRLNEVAPSGSAEVKDEAGDNDPWVELHNLGPGPVNLSGVYLTDDEANPSKWMLPSRTLADGEFLVVWLDGETEEGETHANFRLQPGGAELYLFASAVSTQTPLDSVEYPALRAGQSTIRMGMYGNQWLLTSRPTAAAANPDTGDTGSSKTVMLRINEFMADNESTIQDPDEPGVFEDWVEIYNAGPDAVDMSGMYLTDKLETPNKWQVPQGVTIPAGGYLVFWADEDRSQGPLHMNFKLSADGEAIGLFHPDGQTQIDAVTFGAQQADVSQGRGPEGGDQLTSFHPATPGAANR
jgi:spore coat protein CotH